MKSKHEAQIKKATAALFERGDTDTIQNYFAPSYVAHITGKDVSGGHDMIRGFLALYQKAFAKPIFDSLKSWVVDGQRVMRCGRGVANTLWPSELP